MYEQLSILPSLQDSPGKQSLTQSTQADPRTPLCVLRKSYVWFACSSLFLLTHTSQFGWLRAQKRGFSFHFCTIFPAWNSVGYSLWPIGESLSLTSVSSPHRSEVIFSKHWWVRSLKPKERWDMNDPWWDLLGADVRAAELGQGELNFFSLQPAI